MKVGDLVHSWLTEQTGIVVATRLTVPDKGEWNEGCVQVLWTTQGLSMWSGYKEWKDIRSLEVISESR